MKCWWWLFSKDLAVLLYLNFPSSSVLVSFWLQLFRVFLWLEGILYNAKINLNIPSQSSYRCCSCVPIKLVSYARKRWQLSTVILFSENQKSAHNSFTKQKRCCYSTRGNSVTSLIMSSIKSNFINKISYIALPSWLTLIAF